MDFKENKINNYFLQYLSEISDFNLDKPNSHFHCLNPNHNDNNPSMSVNFKNMTCHCFACNSTYNILDLVKLETNLKFIDALKFLKSKYENYQVPDYINNFLIKNQNNQLKANETLSSLLLKENNSEAVEYLRYKRNIKTAFYQCKFASIKSSQNRIYFILKDFDGNPVAYQSRNITNNNENFRYAKMNGGKTGLYYPSLSSLSSLKKIDGPKILAIFEGEIDSLTAVDLNSCITAINGIKNNNYYPIALSSIANASFFLKELENAYITKDDNIIISLCLDNDERGIETKKYLSKELQDKGFKTNDFPLYFTHKDINDANIEDRENLFIRFQKYLNNLYEKTNQQNFIKDIKEEKYLAQKVHDTNYSKYYFMYGIHYLDNNKLIANQIPESSYFNLNVSLFYSDTNQVASNIYYNNSLKDSNKNSIIEALSHDYVLAKYEDNKRSNKSFISSNILPIDIDNDHSNNEKDWITVDDIKALFKDTSFIIHYSRNHMKEKHDQSPRPRFHVLFEINNCNNVENYANLKNRLHKIFPYIDSNAIDGARFFFGTKNPQIEIYKGNKKLDDFIVDYETKLLSYRPKLLHLDNTKKKEYERG